MKIGTLLTIETYNSAKAETKKYRSKIIEKNEYYLYIDLPIDIETNKTALFREGTLVKITYIDAGQAVHTFTAPVIAQVTRNIPALVIPVPEEKAVETIQRRNFVRIDTAVDVAVHGAEDSFTTVTTDISGGGAAIILPEPHLLNLNERPDLWIVLRMDSGHFEYIKTKVEVIRADCDNHVRKASMKYLSIADKQQQFIIRYCFEKQMEARRQELS